MIIKPDIYYWLRDLKPEEVMEMLIDQDEDMSMCYIPKETALKFIQSVLKVLTKEIED